MTEPTLNINSLRENITYKDGKAKFAQVYRLIVMKKGTDPLNPDKGVEINSYYYSFNDPVVLSDLERAITDQISAYTPYDPYSVICNSKLMDGRYVIGIVITLQNEDSRIVVVSNGNESDFDVMMSE